MTNHTPTATWTLKGYLLDLETILVFPELEVHPSQIRIGCILERSQLIPIKPGSLTSGALVYFDRFQGMDDQGLYASGAIHIIRLLFSGQKRDQETEPLPLPR